MKREFYGHEIACNKLQATIDVYIHHNRIQDCSLRTWLDWQAQWVRVSHNLYYLNNRDLFIDVTRGFHLSDHNILASECVFDNFAQGGSYVNNLIARKIRCLKVLDRATPYHFPHSTEVRGVAVVCGGDDRFNNNIFIGRETGENIGTAHYNGSPTSFNEYIEQLNRQGN